MKTILVCGGRDFDDWDLLNCILYGELLDGKFRVVTGDACGADWLARAWTKFQGLSYKGYPADWKAHGKAAGPIRNKQMLDSEDVDLVIAFPGGKGTADMVRQAKARGIEVREVSYE